MKGMITMFKKLPDQLDKEITQVCDDIVEDAIDRDMAWNEIGIASASYSQKSQLISLLIDANGKILDFVYDDEKRFEDLMIALMRAVKNETQESKLDFADLFIDAAGNYYEKQANELVERQAQLREMEFYAQNGYVSEECPQTGFRTWKKKFEAND